jgi:hypothetical protein
MLPWMPTRACGRRRTFRESDATFSSRRRARNRAAVSGARIKSSVANQVPCELALVKLLSPFPPQCPARPFTRRLPSSRVVWVPPVCSRSRACASARLDATHARERHSERRWHHGTTIYIHTRATVRVGRSDLCLSLSLLCGRGNAQSSSLALRKGLSRGTGTPKRKEAHVGAFPTASTEARAPSTTPARPPARRPRTLHKQTR